MQLTFASYNIHKAVGTDRRRDPLRILAVLRELNPDIIAVQEADMRLGDRASVIERAALDDTAWRAVPVARRARSIGWHGNALLVRRNIEIVASKALDLPSFEPRGAAFAQLKVGGAAIEVIGAHLDLSGLRRRAQIRRLIEHSERSLFGPAAKPGPCVIMGDFNQWGARTGAMQEFSRPAQPWHVATPGRSFPSHMPIARLDRIAASAVWRIEETGVHHTRLSAVASDHLPIWARLSLA